jgi:hypothetical protein
MSGELKWSVASLALTVLSFVVPGGRVLTVPFAFTLVLILLFWGARISAEREES